jgi:NAD-dependent dihydropyrimidine dehydrogenase PreA subunit
MMENSNARHILFCRCNGERINPSLTGSIKDYLNDTRASVTILNDLCGIAVKKSEVLKDFYAAGTEHMIIGCYRRTMDLLIEQAGIDHHTADNKHINLLEETDPAKIREKIDAFAGDSSGPAVYTEIAEDSGWPSWYPVIDYARCTACGQCADFCLFGVYEKLWAKIQVVNPQDCKNNCPACARICPQTALIFPKYKYGGAIGGSEEIDEVEEQNRQTQDISDLLGGDIYVALEQRKLKRRSIIMEEAMRKALEEKEKAVSGITGS